MLKMITDYNNMLKAFKNIFFVPLIMGTVIDGGVKHLTS